MTPPFDIFFYTQWPPILVVFCCSTIQIFPDPAQKKKKKGILVILAVFHLFRSNCPYLANLVPTGPYYTFLPQWPPFCNIVKDPPFSSGVLNDLPFLQDTWMTPFLRCLCLKQYIGTYHSLQIGSAMVGDKSLCRLKLSLHLQFLHYYVAVILQDEVRQNTSSYWPIHVLFVCLFVCFFRIYLDSQIK